MQTQVKNSKWNIDIFSTLNCGGIIIKNNTDKANKKYNSFRGGVPIIN